MARPLVLLSVLVAVACSGPRFESRACPSDAGTDPACGDTTAPIDADVTATATEPEATNGTATELDASAPTDGDPEVGADAGTTGVGPEPGSDEPEDGGNGASDTDPGTDPTELPLDPIEPVACDSPSTGSVRAYFEVPGADGALLGDFFRLPYPNDHWLEGGVLDLSDFPAPTATTRAFSAAIEANADGFSASPTVFFRFSGRIAFDSLVPRFHLLDVTDPERVSSPPLRLLYSPEGGNYVCHDSLSVRPAAGHSLIPGRTYAVWLDLGVVDERGELVERSPQLGALLEDAPPEDPALAALHTKYTPLRTYLAYAAIPGEDVLNATVFTVGEVRSPMQQLARGVAELPVPTASGWVHCDGTQTSPCSDATDARACGAPNDTYDEYHALVELPIFQRGSAPYFDAGGEITLDGPLRTESVCAALSVPKSTPPEGGFPLLLTSHGAGGSFRSHLVDAVAGRASRGVELDGQRVAFAVLGYDGVQHGPRRGRHPLYSGLDPELLLFNFLNPAGTLGTSLQGGLDVLSMARFARTLELPAELGSKASFDPERLLFWGHSQGAMQASISLPYSGEIHAAVFSGLGAGFIQTLLLRQEPALIPQAVRQAVADPGFEGELVFGGEFHPALSLVQHLVDAADPLHHAPYLTERAEVRPLHVFHIYGTGDAFSPGIAQQSFAIAAELAVVSPHASADAAEAFGDPSDEFPLRGNVSVADARYTAGVRLYGPAAGENGHFVAYRVPEAGADLMTFLGTAAVQDAPQIGQ